MFDNFRVPPALPPPLPLSEAPSAAPSCWHQKFASVGLTAFHGMQSTITNYFQYYACPFFLQHVTAGFETSISPHLRAVDGVWQVCSACIGSFPAASAPNAQQVIFSMLHGLWEWTLSALSELFLVLSGVRQPLLDRLKAQACTGGPHAHSTHCGQHCR